MIKIPLMLEKDVKKKCDEAPVAPDPGLEGVKSFV